MRRAERIARWALNAAIALVLMACSTPDGSATETPGVTPPPSTLLTVVTVQVELSGRGGPQRRDGLAPPAMDLGPGSGLHVVVVPTSAPDQPTTALTDELGSAVVQVSPGAYWVYVPRGETTANRLASAFAQTSLPDGTPCLAWVEADIGTEPATVMLQPVVLVP